MVGYIDTIETMGLLDGPGIRFVVFMQGCNLRCLFCHNPETWCGKAKLEITKEELMKRVMRYKNYFADNGGITFSGGEPLLQPDFLIDILHMCKNFGIHTCLDTSGVGIGKYEEILKYVDLVILDIKAIEEIEYQKITGSSIEEFNKFLNICQKLNKKLWLRQVIVPTINDNEEYIKELSKYIKKIKNVEKVELLLYHKMGVHKYEALGIPYKLKNIPELDQEKHNNLLKLLNESL